MTNKDEPVTHNNWDHTSNHKNIWIYLLNHSNTLYVWPYAWSILILLFIVKWKFNFQWLENGRNAFNQFLVHVRFMSAVSLRKHNAHLPDEIHKQINCFVAWFDKRLYNAWATKIFIIWIYFPWNGVSSDRTNQ